MHFNQVKLHIKRFCGAFGLLLFIIRVIRIPEECDPGDMRCSLLQEFETLGREFVLQQRNAGRVAAGSTETRYETELLRIGAAEKYERDRFIKFLCNPSDVAADCQHHIGLEDYQFGCQNWKPVDPSFRITRFDRDISSLDVTQVAETPSD